MLFTNVLALFKNKAKFVSRQIKVCMPELFCVQLVTLGEPTIVIMNLGISIKPYICISLWASSTGKQEATKNCLCNY